MEILIQKERDDPFLNRIDLEVLIKHPNAATPSKEWLQEEIAKKYNVDKDQVVIKYIMSKKGLQEAISKIKILKEKPIKRGVEKIETQESENKQDVQDQKQQS